MINNVVKPFKRPSHDRKISGGKEMASSQDKSQELAEWELPNSDHRIAKDSEAAFFTQKSKPHLAKLISVIVELSGRYSKVFRDLVGESVGLCSDLNDNSQKTRKPVTLHGKTIDSNRFKVKAKIPSLYSYHGNVRVDRVSSNQKRLGSSKIRTVLAATAANPNIKFPNILNCGWAYPCVVAYRQDFSRIMEW